MMRVNVLGWHVNMYLYKGSVFAIVRVGEKMNVLEVQFQTGYQFARTELDGQWR
jgi:hypothetical protein